MVDGELKINAIVAKSAIDKHLIVESKAKIKLKDVRTIEMKKEDEYRNKPEMTEMQFEHNQEANVIDMDN